MSERLTPDELKAIEEREKDSNAKLSADFIKCRKTGVLHELDDGDRCWVVCISCEAWFRDWDEARGHNAAIAELRHAREDIPKLIREVRRLQHELAVARVELIRSGVAKMIVSDEGNLEIHIQEEQP